MLLRAFGFVFIVTALLPLAASAQSLDATTPPFSLSLSPQYPMPFGQSVVTPSSNSVDLSNAVMTMTVNTKKVYQGSPQPLAIPLGGAGSVTTVKITMTSNGVPFTQTFTIRPEDVALVAEPLSTAPPLYAGKPLVPLEGTVRLVAVANLKDAKGKSIDPARLSYSWSVDDAQVGDGSGIGKDSLLVDSPLQYRSRDVSVAVQTQDGTLTSGASLTLIPEEPVVRLYESDPLLGILYDHTISSSFSIPGAEKSLFAAPYSFPSGPLSLAWFLNGSSAQQGNVITLRPTGAGEGEASLSIVASAGDSTTATTNLSLSFGAPKSGFGIFGL